MMFQRKLIHSVFSMVFLYINSSLFPLYFSESEKQIEAFLAGADYFRVSPVYGINAGMFDGSRDYYYSNVVPLSWQTNHWPSNSFIYSTGKRYCSSKRFITIMPMTTDIIQADRNGLENITIYLTYEICAFNRGE